MVSGSCPCPRSFAPLDHSSRLCSGGVSWRYCWPVRLLFAAEFGSGFGVMLLDISIGAIFAAVIPDALRARVSGAYLLVNYGVRPLGALAGGALGTWIGLRPSLLVAAIGGMFGFLWLLPSPLPRMRDLPEGPEIVP